MNYLWTLYFYGLFVNFMFLWTICGLYVCMEYLLTLCLYGLQFYVVDYLCIADILLWILYEFSVIFFCIFSSEIDNFRRPPLTAENSKYYFSAPVYFRRLSKGRQK